MTTNQTNSTPLTDEQLDAVLAQWATPPMDATLPSRIVQAAQRDARQRFWRRSLTAAASAAAVLVFTVLLWPTDAPTTITGVHSFGNPAHVPATTDHTQYKVDGLSDDYFQHVMDSFTAKEFKAFSELKGAQRNEAFHKRLKELQAQE